MAQSRLRAGCCGTQRWPVPCAQGLSTELGAFVAGVMLSATDQQEHALSQLEHVKHFFLSLFIASTGLVMSPGFLMQHLKILAGMPALSAQQSNLPLPRIHTEHSAVASHPFREDKSEGGAETIPTLL